MSLKEKIQKKEMELSSLKRMLEEEESRPTKVGYLKSNLYAVDVMFQYDWHYTQYLTDEEFNSVITKKLLLEKDTVMHYRPDCGWYDESGEIEFEFDSDENIIDIEELR